MAELGTVYSIKGDHRQAIAYLQRALATCAGERLYERNAGHNMLSVLCCNTLTLTLAERGAFATGREYGEEGHRIAAAVEKTRMTAVETERVVQEKKATKLKTRGAPLTQRFRYLAENASVTVTFRRRNVTRDDILTALDEARTQVEKGPADED